MPHATFYTYIWNGVQICLNGGKYKTVLGLLKNKIPRLIIPYFLVSILYNIPILWCSNYFGGSVYNVILYLIGFGKNHLWYLEALFIIFVLTYACNSILIGFMKIQKRNSNCCNDDSSSAYVFIE